MPAVVTVNGSAAECRPRHAKLVMKYKHALSKTEVAELATDNYKELREQRPYLSITELSAADVPADENQLGLLGSPTKVKKIDNVVFQAKEAKRLSSSQEDIDSLMQELISNHTLG